MKLFCSLKLDISNNDFSQIVIFKNGGTCIDRRILDVMIRVLSKLLMSKLTDTSAYVGM